MDNRFVISRRNLFMIFFVLFGYMIYSPMTSHYLTNPDGMVIGLVYKPYTEGEDLGRIGIEWVDWFFGRIISPNLMLIVSCCILGITVWLLIRIFHIESFTDMILAGMLILLMPTISSTFTYYYCMVPYTLACLLCVGACYITIRYRQKWIFIIGGCLVAASLTLYQAYLSVAVVVVLLYLIYMVCREHVKKVLVMASRLSLMGITGAGLYLLLLKVLKIQLSSSRGFDRMGQISLSQLPALIGKAYSAFFDYFCGNTLLNNTYMHRRVLNFGILTLCVGLLAFLFIKKKMYKEIGKTILFWGSILLLPIGFEFMVIAAPGVDTFGTTGILLVPAMGLVYVSVIFLGRLVKETLDVKNDFWNKLIQYSYLIVIVPVIWNLVLFTAAFENVMWLNYQGTYSLCEKISERIEIYADANAGGGYKSYDSRRSRIRQLSLYL